MRKAIVLDHYVQRLIFSELAAAQTVRFSELRPEGVESNLFTYHLQKMVAAGYVEKTGQGEYCLSTEGKKMATSFSFDENNLVSKPTALSILAVYDRQGRGPLAYRRKRQPYFEKISLPSGKIHQGELSKTAAARELQEKLGYADCDSIDYAGTVTVATEDGNHIVGIVWKCIVPTLIEHASKTGRTEKLNWTDVDFKATIFGTLKLVELAGKDTPFFLDLSETA